MDYSQTIHRPPSTCLELDKCCNKHLAFGDNTNPDESKNYDPDDSLQWFNLMDRFVLL